MSEYVMLYWLYSPHVQFQLLLRCPVKFNVKRQSTSLIVNQRQ